MPKPLREQAVVDGVDPVPVPTQVRVQVYSAASELMPVPVRPLADGADVAMVLEDGEGQGQERKLGHPQVFSVV